MESPFNPSDQHGNIDFKIVALLERLAVVIRSMLQQLATEHGLSPIQVESLVFLLHHAPEFRRTGLLSQEFLVSQPTMSDALAVLEEKGLIDRTPDPSDARAKQLKLSAKGQRVAKLLERWAGPLMDGLAEVSDGDKRVTLNTLMQLTVNLSRHGHIPVNRMCLTCRFFKPAAKSAVDHYCNLLEVPLPPTSLRIDCPEHESG